MDEIIAQSNSSHVYQRRWALALSAFVFGTYIANCGLGMEHIIGVPQSTVSAACKSLIVLSLVFCLGDLPRRDIIPLLVVVSFLFVISVVQLVLFPRLKIWFLDDLREFLLLCLPMVLCVLMLDDYDAALKRLSTTSILIGIINALITLIYGGGFFTGYSMGYSNSLILPVDVLWVAASDSSKKLPYRTMCLVLALMCAFSIAAYGSRGSLIATVAFMLVYSFTRETNSGMSLVTKVTVASAALLGAANFKEIAQALYSMVLKAGFSSRTLLLLATDIQHDSSRSLLWSEIWHDIVHDPFAIRGICSDYALLGQYCHNIVLSVWHSLGMFLGTLFLLYVIILAVRTLSASHNAESSVALLLFWTCFPILFWSGDFWTNCFFWSWFVLMNKMSNASTARLSSRDGMDAAVLALRQRFYNE